MKPFTITFTAAKGTVRLTQQTKLAAELRFSSRLSISIWYDSHEEPLVLSADVSIGDKVCLTVRSYHIELSVNGRLTDEEWPCGTAYLQPNCKWSGDFSVTFEELSSANEANISCCTRAGISTGEIRIPGVNIGDCIPYSDETETDGRYHLFYLYDRHHHCSKWKLGAHQWAHVSSTDLRRWDEHPMAIGITEAWEGSICTGSVVRAEGAWYAWYAVRMSDRSPARITYAISTDRVHFKKSGTYFHMPQGYEPTSARDPKVFWHDGSFHMFVTTTLLENGSGCLAHLVNDRMEIHGWQDAGCTMIWREHTTPESADWNAQPECPDWFQMGHFYYLIFGIGGVSYYGYSTEPYGGWLFPENNLIPCGAVPKSAILPDSGRRIFMGFRRENGYAGDLCATEAVQNPDGTLRFTPVEL